MAVSRAALDIVLTFRVENDKENPGVNARTHTPDYINAMYEQINVHKHYQQNSINVVSVFGVHDSVFTRGLYRVNVGFYSLEKGAAVGGLEKLIDYSEAASDLRAQATLTLMVFVQDSRQIDIHSFTDEQLAMNRIIPITRLEFEKNKAYVCARILNYIGDWLHSVQYNPWADITEEASIAASIDKHCVIGQNYSEALAVDGVPRPRYRNNKVDYQHQVGQRPTPLPFKHPEYNLARDELLKLISK